MCRASSWHGGSVRHPGVPWLVMPGAILKGGGEGASEDAGKGEKHMDIGKESERA